MTLAAETTLYAGSNTLSVDELALYHAINDLRVANGLTALKPSYDMTVIAGQHAADFDNNVGYASWSAVTVAARPVPSLHHWSDGQSFLNGVLALGTGLKLVLPQTMAENADAVLAGSVQTNVLATWVANPGTYANILSSSWDTMGVGIDGDMVYVTFGNYAKNTDATAVAAIVGGASGETIRSTAWADNISGMGGNDVFVSLTNGDSIDGGTGTDRITLSGTAATYKVTQTVQNGQIGAVITGGSEGEINVHNVEYIQFADRIIDSSSWGESLTSVHFDASYYARTNVDVAGAVTAGAFATVDDHFWSFGKVEGRDAAAFFDTDYYLAHNPDIALAIQNGAVKSAFDHYLLFGQFEGRNPNAYFDTADYLKLNPDVASAIAAGQIGSAIDHYLTFGRYEGRMATDDFSESYYLAHNPDVAAAVAAGAFDSGYTHYRLIGQVEGRLPFDASLVG